MNKLTVVASGRKQAGKNSICNYSLAKYLNRKSAGTMQPGEKFKYSITDKGNLHLENIRAEIVERYNANSYRTELKDHSKTFEILAPDKFASPSGRGAKIYSFADPLKQFCINVFGAKYEQMYGTDAQKNSIIPHLLWDNLPDIMRPVIGKYIEPINPSHIIEEHKHGPMTGRDLMQVFGTDMVRRLYNDAWARATYSAIQNDGQELALVCDGRFPNEIDMGTTVNAKTIRLLRAVYTEDTHLSETALDNYPLEKYTVVVDNRNMTLDEQCKFLDPLIDAWFNEAGFR